jgi:hypothetical protein
MSRARKAMAIWGVALAAFAMFMAIILFTGAAGAVFGMVPAATVGMGLSFGAYEKRAGNSILVWIGMSINSVFMAMWLILIVIRFITTCL